MHFPKSFQNAIGAHKDPARIPQGFHKDPTKSHKDPQDSHKIPVDSRGIPWERLWDLGCFSFFLVRSLVDFLRFLVGFSFPKPFPKSVWI